MVRPHGSNSHYESNIPATPCAFGQPLSSDNFDRVVSDDEMPINRRILIPLTNGKNIVRAQEASIKGKRKPLKRSRSGSFEGCPISDHSVGTATSSVVGKAVDQRQQLDLRLPFIRRGSRIPAKKETKKLQMRGRSNDSRPTTSLLKDFEKLSLFPLANLAKLDDASVVRPFLKSNNY